MHALNTADTLEAVTYCNISIYFLPAKVSSELFFADDVELFFTADVSIHSLSSLTELPLIAVPHAVAEINE